MKILRYFTTSGVSPFDQITWNKRDVRIDGDTPGTVVFEQKDVEAPASWSDTAVKVVASRYFRGAQGTPQRETSVRQVVERVARTIAASGAEQGYFDTNNDTAIFQDELIHLLINQKMSFNSPVWFNVGISGKPQVSACFINSVEDSMESILELVKTEGMLFKDGSGSGTNLSSLRSSKESLSGTGGKASGPVSFMKGYDAFAGVIKSGGKTRRAAVMRILNADHPDIFEFVRCKTHEEKKARALIAAGYDGSFNGEAYKSVFFQNSNNSVRVTDKFMQAVKDDNPWQLKAVTTDEIVETVPARKLFREIAENAHFTGDPGIQFHDTINRWNTCAKSGEIVASNPCGEYTFLQDSACNLASLNLLKFRRTPEVFDWLSFRNAVFFTILAQDILVDMASYPTEAIRKNSHDFRPLGLGYANLGALLMEQGIPYDSDEGRKHAAEITAYMTACAYAASSNIALAMGAFRYFSKNKARIKSIIKRHAETPGASPGEWMQVRNMVGRNKLRNAQVTLLAPTGTIGFMMDCDTTGIEPDLGLIKHKKLAGGGVLRLVNKTVPRALERLGYSSEETQAIVDYLDKTDTIEGAPGFKPEHLAVFDCAFPSKQGGRCISPEGHIKMMAAVQPFLSGAISKTVNLPNNATVEDIERIYMMAWELGLKSIALYRDGCKLAQPISTAGTATSAAPAPAPETSPTPEAAPAQADPIPVRRKLPRERKSITHKFEFGGHEGYVIVGMYEDGTPGEIFIEMSQMGSTVRGLMDAFAVSISLGLQHGVPLQTLARKFIHSRFEPSGFTMNPEIRIAKSVVDYIFRWLELKFLKPVAGTEATPPPNIVLAVPIAPTPTFQNQADAPMCPECGSIMVRSGACYKCANCGSTNGCS